MRGSDSGEALRMPAMGERLMIHVYMDDARPCPKGFTLARNGEECLLLLEHERVGILSLDHEMGWHQMNGTQVAQQMVERGLFAEHIYLHTSSSMGRMAMFQLLYPNKPEGVRVYNHAMPDELLDKVAAEAGAQGRGERE